MRLIVWSDLQCHSWAQHSHITADGFNSRLLDCLLVIDQVGAYARRVKADGIVFCGDLVERIGEQDTEVMALLHDRLRRLASAEIPLDMIPGNHERASSDLSGGLHAMSGFKGLPWVTVHDKLDLVECPGFGVTPVFLPWQPSREAFYAKLEKAREWAAQEGDLSVPLLFCHQAFEGGLMCDEGYSPDDEIPLAPDAFEPFAAVFTGHLHRFKKLTRYSVPVYQVGAPLHHKKNDASDPGRGFLDVTVKDGEVRVDRVLVDAPEFVALTVGSRRDLKALPSRPGDFVYVTVTDPTLPRDEVTPAALKARIGATSVVVDGVVREAPESRLAVSLSGERTAWVDAYVSQQAPDGLSKKRLVKWMTRFMEEGGEH